MSSLGQVKDAVVGLRDHFSRPTLRTLLTGDEPCLFALRQAPEVIDVRSIVRWDEWSSEDYPFPRWQGREVLSQPKLPLGSCRITEDWECDIQDVSGLAASKSDLSTLTSLDHMAAAACPEMISELTVGKLEENLAHREIRILHQPSTTDCFVRFTWDKRIFLMNSGGSHHFAAARYIAARLRKAVPLKGTLRTYSLDPASVAALVHDFDVYAIPDAAFGNVHRALRPHRISYGWLHLPPPFEDVMALFLPKSPRTARISGELRTSGAFNMGTYLKELAQTAI